MTWSDEIDGHAFGCCSVHSPLDLDEARLSDSASAMAAAVASATAEEADDRLAAASSRASEAEALAAEEVEAA